MLTVVRTRTATDVFHAGLVPLRWLLCAARLGFSQRACAARGRRAGGAHCARRAPDRRWSDRCRHEWTRVSDPEAVTKLSGMDAARSRSHKLGAHAAAQRITRRRSRCQLCDFEQTGNWKAWSRSEGTSSSLFRLDAPLRHRRDHNSQTRYDAPGIPPCSGPVKEWSRS